MRTFTLSFNMDNAEFEDDEATEIAIILRAVSYDIQYGSCRGIIYDLNGNSIGSYKVGEDE